MFGKWPFDSNKQINRQKKAASRQPFKYCARDEKDGACCNVDVAAVVADVAEEKCGNDCYDGDEGLFWQMMKMDVDERGLFLKSAVGNDKVAEVEELFCDWLNREWFANGVSEEQLQEIDRHAEQCQCSAETYIRYFYPNALVDWIIEQYKLYKGN